MPNAVAEKQLCSEERVYECLADQLGVTVQRPADQETTALGSAFLAGLAEGVWADLAAIQATWQLDASSR